MKKSPSPLEKKRPMFFAAGLLFAVSITLVSFEWRVPYNPYVFERPVVEPPENPYRIPNTFHEEKKKKDKPEPPKLEPSTDFEIKDEVVDEEPNEEPLTIEDFDDIPTSDMMPAEAEVPDEDYKIWEWASEMPKYCEGNKALNAFLANELEYPEIPRMNGISGVVIVEFIVGRDGSLRDAKIARSVDPWLDAEALRVAKKLECFTPGKQAGRNVDVYLRLPVRFTLGG